MELQHFVIQSFIIGFCLALLERKSGKNYSFWTNLLRFFIGLFCLYAEQNTLRNCVAFYCTSFLLDWKNRFAE
jgi:hydrogenase-4 membrane subunit HyfE